jgi:hypothetical protein
MGAGGSRRDVEARILRAANAGNVTPGLRPTAWKV